MQGIGNATMLLGRVLLSLLFLIGGTIKLLGASARQAMFVKQGCQWWKRSSFVARGGRGLYRAADSSWK